jgi:hypothetical protein
MTTKIHLTAIQSSNKMIKKPAQIQFRERKTRPESKLKRKAQSSPLLESPSHPMRASVSKPCLDDKQTLSPGYEDIPPTPQEPPLSTSISMTSHPTRLNWSLG